MTENPASLAEEFERNRPRLRAVAYRMLGSPGEADDAVQELWLRLERGDLSDVRDLRSYLTTSVARVSVDMLRARRARPELPLERLIPEPIVSPETGVDPEHEALLGDAVGWAMLVVLQSLGEHERVAFVLHDAFAVPFGEIATLLGRTPAAARQLASRARRRVRAAPVPDPDLDLQKEVVAAFLSASRAGDLAALIAVLDPEATLRIDRGRLPVGGPRTIHGAASVARRGLAFSRLARLARPLLINGAAGFAVVHQRRTLGLAGVTVTGGRVAQIDLLTDPTRLAALGLPGCPPAP